MRYFVLALMIFLLPLRGWTGDAMATHMASTALNSEAGAPRIHETSALTDCAGHPSSEKSDSSEAQSAHGETCQACQACHTVVLASCTATVGTLLMAPSPQLVTTTQFTSADTALGQKPPIS